MNLLGKGIAYGDVRNVTSSLSREAAEAFVQEYSGDIDEEQKKADAFIAPVATSDSYQFHAHLPHAQRPLG